MNFWKWKKCGCKKSFFTYGPVLIALGSGMVLAYIMPYYLLIIIMGIALVICGISCLKKK